MIIDSYSLFIKDLEKKSKYFLEYRSSVYEPIHIKQKKSGDIVLYVSQVPEPIRLKAKNKPSWELSAAGQHISGLYIPDYNRPDIGYGDIKGTEDALLWIKVCCQIELMVFKGKKPVKEFLYSMLASRSKELEQDINGFRKQANIQNATNK